MKLNAAISPLTYIGVLMLMFLASFATIPLGWHADVVMNGRYNSVFFYFIISFLIGIVVAYFMPVSTEGKSGEKSAVNSNLNMRYFKIISLIVVCFNLARFVSLGQIPLLGNLSARYFDNKLGGFVDYTANLSVFLCWISAFLYQQSRKKRFLILSAILVLLSILYFQRQIIFSMIIGVVLYYHMNSKVKAIHLVGYLISGLTVFYAMGLLNVMRAGAENVSTTIPVEQLPFWVALADFTGAIKLGYAAADSFGPSGLGGLYTFGVWGAIMQSDAAHGAELLRVALTDRAAAQSIAAPLSFYIDGGIPLVIAIGAFEGFSAHFLWRWASRTNLPIFKMAYIASFLQLVWSLRAGVFIFEPSQIYGFGLLVFLFKGRSVPNIFTQLGLVVKVGFVATFAFTNIVLFVRLAA